MSVYKTGRYDHHLFRLLKSASRSLGVRWSYMLCFAATMMVSVLSYGASIPADVTIDFNSSGFIESADHGSDVFTQGDFTITYDAANWFQDVDDGEGGSAGLFAGGFTGVETITIQTTSGNEFDFSSFFINAFGGGFASVEGFRDSGSTGIQSTGIGFDETAGTYTVTLNSTFDNVDRVVITSNNSGFFDVFDSFVFNTVPTPTPTITSATYDASTGALVVTGTNFSATGGATNDVVANKFTLTAEGGSYILTDTANVEISSATSFTLTLSATDRAAANLIVNKNGTSSTGGTTYNLAGAAGFIAASPATADLTGNGITVSNIATPTVTSATYDGSTGVLVVTGANFKSFSGAANDIVANRFTFTGEGGNTWTLTDTANVEITSGTSFTMVLSATDREGVDPILNKNGTSSIGATTYNLAAAEDWAAGADAAVTVADLTGNGITVSNAADTVAPTATIVVADTVLVIGDTSLVTITFSEAVTGFTNADLTIPNGSLTAVSSSDGGITWTATLTPSAGVKDTTNVITLDNAGVTDLASNPGTGTTNSNNYEIATTRPTASIVVADTSLAAGETSLVTITFSEAVSGFSNADLTIANGTLSAVSSSDGGITWTATFTPTASVTDATNLITLNNTGVANIDGNTGAGTTDSNNYAIDTARPTATIVVADTALAAGETSLVTITFSEAVAGFSNADLTVANGTLSAVSSSDGGITWTATFTPAASTTDTTNLITLDNTGVSDAAGNAGTGTTDSNNYAIDTARPTATIVVADTNLSVGETSLVTITFSEAVAGFTNADLTIANATLSAVSSSDGGITWTATLTPAASTNDATNVITLNNTGVVDAAGNTGTGTTDSNNYAVATASPTVSSVSIAEANGTYKIGDTLSVQVNFSEAVFLSTGTLQLTLETGATDRTASYLAGSGSSSLFFSYTVQAGDNSLDLDYVSTAALAANGDTIQSGAFVDAILMLPTPGAANSLGANKAIVIDGIRPTASIVVADTALAVGETSTVTITFSEAVSGFTTADLTVANGAMSGLSSSDGGITWTATLSPSADTSDTTNLVTLDNTGVQDAAGNTGSGTTDSNNYAIDTLRPTASIVVADNSIVIGETSFVTITFSEAVAGFTNADLTVANGVLTAVSSADGGTTWTATFTPNASVEDTTNLITVNNTGVTDAAGNAGTGTTDSNNYAIDTLRPAIAGSITVSDTALKTGETAVVTFTFTEAVMGFTTADLTVANGVVSGLGSSDGGITWTATLTPNASTTAATNVITLDLTGVQDLAGNSGVGSADSVNYAIDSENPTVTSVTVPTNGSYTTNQVLGFTINTDSAITVVGTPRIALTLGADTRYANYVSGSGTSALLFSYTVQANENDTDGVTLAASIDLNGGTMRDVAENDLTLTLNSVAATTGVLVDTTAPADTAVTTPANAVQTNIASYVVAGTHGEDGVTIKLFADADNDGTADDTAFILSAIVTDGVWSFEPILTANSENNYVVIAEDTAGNVSAAIDVPTITHDDIAPAAPAALDLSDASDSGSSNTDNITNVTASVITGTAEANSTVTLSSDLDDEVGTAVADGAGVWSITTTALSVGEHLLTATATDAATNTGAASASLTVTVDTDVPTITDIANQGVALGGSTGALAFTVADNLTAAADLTLTADSSNIVAVPLANVVLGGSDANRTVTVTSAASGASTVTVTVEDLAGNMASDTFVVGVNSTPTIGGTPATSVDQDVAYSFTPSAADIDGDGLIFSITNLPAWASFDTATGALTGTPTRDNVGSFANIVISVSDGTVSASLPAFAIDVGYVNAAPEITGSPLLVANIGAAYSFSPTASDSDDDELTFSATGLPAWLTLDTATGLLSGTPAAADANTSTSITVSVSDGSLSDSLPAFTLEVEYSDDAPVVEAPAAVTLNATALYTPISLRQLLGLSPAVTQEEIDEALAGLASDSTDGNACCTTRPDGLSPSNLLLLPPGRHEIVWQAINAAGLTGSAIQVLDLRPLVSFSKQQVAVRGSEISLRVILNGPSPVYPLDIPYVIDETTTALPDEHSLTDGIASFTEAGQIEVVIPVQLAALSGAGDSQLVLRLDDETAAGEPVTDSLFDINAGAANRHIISIREGNVAPTVSVQLTQGGNPTGLITPGGGPVTAAAIVVDPNTGDTHSFDWSATSSDLIDSDGDSINTTWVFDPAGLSGRYFLQVTVTDSAGGTGMTQQYFRVVGQLPVLDPMLDSDGDGIDDLTEGSGDTSGNGIPDYLDNMPSSNILPQVIGITNAYLIECDPGVRCRIGPFALVGNSGGVQILDNEVALGFEITPDETFEPVGGIFDFEIKDLPTPGQNVRVVIPQQAAIPANAVYRKFQNGSWVNFMEDANNELHSTAGNLGYCPPPGTADWQPGLTEGHFCVQLTLQDGGPNDADGEINAAVVDPGAVSSELPVIPPVTPPVEPPTQIKSKGSGAVQGAWLLLLAGLFALRQPRRLRGRLVVVAALLAAAFNTQAQTFTDDLYLRADLYRAEGNQTAEGYSGSLAADGHTITLTDYTILRRGYQVALGYRWNEMTYSELGYLDLGSVRVDLLLPAGDDLEDFERSFAKHYPRTANGITLVQGVTFPLNSDVSFAAELGAFVWRNEVDVREGIPSPQDTDGTAPLVGVQLNFALSEPLSVGLGIRRVFLDDEAVDLWGVNARWGF